MRTLLSALPRARMAFSLHAADDETRSRLMPINRRVNLEALAEAMREYVDATKRRVTVQYVLLRGVCVKKGKTERRSAGCVRAHASLPRLMIPPNHLT